MASFSRAGSSATPRVVLAYFAEELSRESLPAPPPGCRVGFDTRDSCMAAWDNSAADPAPTAHGWQDKTTALRPHRTTSFPERALKPACEKLLAVRRSITIAIDMVMAKQLSRGSCSSSPRHLPPPPAGQAAVPSVVLSYFDEELSRELGKAWRFAALRKQAMRKQNAASQLLQMTPREELLSFARDRGLKVQEGFSPMARTASSSRRLTRASSVDLSPMASARFNTLRWTCSPSSAHPEAGFAPRNSEEDAVTR